MKQTAVEWLEMNMPDISKHIPMGIALEFVGKFQYAKDLEKKLTPQWIKVTDRLPEVNQKIDLWLVPDDARKPRRMSWTWENGQTEKTTIAGCKVTHWMPYTEPPEV